MKVKYLFPNKYKKIGLFILIPLAIIGLLTLILDYEPDFLTLNVPAIFINELFGDNYLFGMKQLKLFLYHCIIF